MRKGEKRVQGRKLVVDPAAEEPRADDHRRRHPRQGLFEVRAVLFRDPVPPVGRDRRQGIGGKRIEIPDHRVRHDARRRGQRQATVDRHHPFTEI